jgi:hypothetical protein
LDGSPDEWQQAIAKARTRWQHWLTSSHDFDAGGQLQFGKRTDDMSTISTTLVRTLAAELDK